MRYNNYHKHDHKGNARSVDVYAKEEDYCKRAVELGHTTVFTTNHGMQGDIFTWLECSRKYGLKMIYGTEAYYVRDRIAEIDGTRDRSNRHIIIIAKNNSGAEQLNDILSEAQISGFYYRPRIDDELLFSLDPRNFVITSACVAGIWNNHELMLRLSRYFGENFMLEVQTHNIDLQKRVNADLISFSKESGIKLIHANDSHYIYPEDAQYRDIFLKGNDISYKDENGMILDYPDSDEILRRYRQQGILSEAQVQEALENTLIFDDCEEITIIDDEIKLPQVSKDPTRELKSIINKQWIKERENIPREQWNKYFDAIRYEVDIIEKTHMENYFLIDYHVAKNAQEKYGGRLTNTGRGSAPSFYVTKLLGLTDINRIDSPITLFPTRFMSVERILGAKSLPDIDLNTSDRVPFIKATEDLLGAENCAWMISWKPLQSPSAFRVYCKGIGKQISEYDEIAKNIDTYRDHPKWGKLIKESERFVGTVRSISESPCSMLLYDQPVRKKIGLIRTDTSICCLLDGYNCDKYKYLKNDYLTVTVWAIIRDTCKMAGIPIPTIKELDALLDDKTFEVYEKGLTCTINQADSDFATNIVMRYKPKSVSEMSAFVAIIRPGCASLLQDFIDRKPYTTGVEELDNLLVEGKHRMIYQELIMKYLIWLGVEETGSYDIIKKIAKKKFKEPELAELKEKLLSGWMKQVGKEDGFIETWTVVEQAARYSFNASHSLSYAYDSLYGAYLKSHYPLEYYTVALNYYADDSTRTTKLIKELPYYGISLKPIRFRYSKAEYNMSKDDNSIYKGIQSIKGMNSQFPEEMYALRNNTYETFVDLLIDLKDKTKINSRQLSELVELDFFEEFGDANYLLRMIELFDYLYDKKQVSKDKARQMGIKEEYIVPYAGKETEKTFMSVNTTDLLKHLSKCTVVQRRSLHDKVKSQIEYLGYTDISDNRYSKMLAIIEVDTKYSPKIKAHALKNGNQITCKIDKMTFNKTKIQPGDIIRVYDQTFKPKLKRLENGNFEQVPGEKELWLKKYEIYNNL